MHVANVVHANLLAARATPAERIAGQVFNVGSGQRVSVNDLWDRIRDLAGVPVLPKYVEGRPGEVRDSLAAIDKARDLLGYTPVVDFEQGAAAHRRVLSRPAQGSAASPSAGSGARGVNSARRYGVATRSSISRKSSRLKGFRRTGRSARSSASRVCVEMESPVVNTMRSSRPRPSVRR